MRGEPAYWLRIDPTGHVKNVITVDVAGTVRENVHQRFTRTAAGRRREAYEGWQHKAVSTTEMQSRAMPCLMGECSHLIPFAEALSGRLKLAYGRAVHATRTGPRGTVTGCEWIAGPKDKPMPPGTPVTCRACTREIERNTR
jgi:hypothetical protein